MKDLSLEGEFGKNSFPDHSKLVIEKEKIGWETVEGIYVTKIVLL